ncbi:sufA Fe-S cluster assembly scaffold protein [uncultured Caudovirales phage]|uniref:SufA Fe-S cluster assembly scaffold protein n=1 Tax=uncultured Caudovirales phage TaxID=2100421 RepID=A0A6J5LYJ8_9CAUD|nr:sufA Fe-S cluster assembly scaffold protein [uncultured Caudovirales phage]
MISVTESAVKKIQQQLQRRGRGLGIRIGVRTTGCSGLAYVLEYVDQLNPGDDAELHDGFSVIINKKDQPYLQNLEIDYVRQGLNEGFEFNNPNEKDRCGCGESFRI